MGRVGTPTTQTKTPGGQRTLRCGAYGPQVEHSRYDCREFSEGTTIDGGLLNCSNLPAIGRMPVVNFHRLAMVPI